MIHKQIAYLDDFFYSNFHRWGVNFHGFNPVSYFPLKMWFPVVWYLWFLERKCLYSSNTSHPKKIERWDFILVPEVGHANLSFVWRPTRDRLMSIIWRQIFKKTCMISSNSFIPLKCNGSLHTTKMC